MSRPICTAAPGSSASPTPTSNPTSGSTLEPGWASLPTTSSFRTEFLHRATMICIGSPGEQPRETDALDGQPRAHSRRSTLDGDQFRFLQLGGGLFPLLAQFFQALGRLQ